MNSIRFDALVVEGSSARLVSPRFQGKIEARADGIWRVLVWHRLEDAGKTSWVVAPSDPCEIRAEKSGDSWKLNAGMSEELIVTLDPFTVSCGSFSASEFIAHRWKELSRRKDMPDDATWWDAIGEANDGLPLGCGISMQVIEKSARRYYGLGERAGFLDKKGRVWTNWNTDPGSRHNENLDPLYQSHPFVMALEGSTSAEAPCAFGLYLDETWRTVFDLAATDPDRSVLHTDGPTFDLYLIPGPTPADVLGKFTALAGRAPLPPLWALGYHQCRWSYPTDRVIRSIVRQYRARGIPLDAVWLDIDYMDAYKVFTFSPSRFPEPEALIRELKSEGVRTVAIVDPGVKKESGYGVYENGKELNVFVRNSRDEEFEGEVWPGKTVFPDFTREAVRGWWGGLHRIYLDVGLDGIWNDMNEPAVFKGPGHSMPTNARHGERLHAEVHNIYGSMMSRATHEGLTAFRPYQRPFILTRAGFSGIQKYAWVWTGDNTSAWEHLEMSIPMILNLGMSGVPFSGADIGGFADHCDGELLARWTWLGAFYPFMRNHAGKGSRRQEPWEFGERYEKIVRDAILFRYRILPYLYTLAEEASRTGLPPLRPLMLHYPEDPRTHALHDQFLMGQDLLVAPVTRPGATERMVYLPRGVWFDLWTGARYEGGASIVAQAPLERIPVFVRAGACVPTVTPLQHTKTAHWDPLIWIVAPADTMEGKVFDDEGDGHAPGKVRGIKGRREDGAITLELSDKLPASAVLLGMAAPADGAAQPTEAGCEVKLTKSVALLKWA